MSDVTARDAIVVLNAGPTSLKFGAYEISDDGSLPVLCRGRFAIKCFVYAMQKYIGENSSSIRAALCDRLAWLGVRLDADANTSGGPCISSPESAVSVWVIPTNEQ